MTRTLAPPVAPTAGAGGPGHPPAGLTWGVKRSLLQYIAGLPDGGHTTSGGAYVCETSFFTFPPERGADNTQECAELRFRGSLQLGGHAGMLQIIITDPRVVRSESGMVLTIADRTGGPGESERLAIADLEINDAYRTRHGLVLPLMTATLTSAGCEIFGGHYPPGEQLDPLFAFAPRVGGAAADWGADNLLEQSRMYSV